MARQSRPREALRELTSELNDTPQDWAAGYRAFMRKIGGTAQTYDTYINAAVTSAGYRRDTSLSRQEAISRNTDTALLIADEAASHDLIDLEQAVDAVSLGYIPTWAQSTYLLFFFGVMARPDDAHLDDIANALSEPDGYDLDIMDDQDLPHEVRFPHYMGLTDHFWSTVQQVPHIPISTMVESFDRTMTLGGRAEERLALHMGIRILQPTMLAGIADFRTASISPELKTHYENLTALGADLFAPPTVPTFHLRQILNSPES